jgi:hypothetical protein
MSPTTTLVAPSASRSADAPVLSASHRNLPANQTRRRAIRVISALSAAAILFGLLGVAGLGFATHEGLGTTRLASTQAHAPTRGSRHAISPLVSPSAEIVTADVAAASPDNPACVCSSPYVGAVDGPPIVENVALSKLVDSLWRSGASVGDGSTFDAVEYEATTGQLVGGTTHFQKLAQGWQNLTRLMKTQDLSESDRAIANELDERFLQATVDIERNPVAAMEANLRAGKSPISGFSNAAMDVADPELAAEEESIEPLLEELAVAAEDAAEDG